mmetsp:Transcript_44188/g.86713  ORF Transcript_44188/g.86713 Transcript_44188/m.86713 type:complete len:551 (+) Transcript_44188:124-1776(+)
MNMSDDASFPEQRALGGDAEIEMEENAEYANEIGLTFGYKKGDIFQLIVDVAWDGKRKNVYDVTRKESLQGSAMVSGKQFPKEIEFIDIDGDDARPVNAMKFREDMSIDRLYAQLSWSSGCCTSLRGVQMNSALVRRLRDVQYARLKRCHKYDDYRTQVGFVEMYKYLRDFSTDLDWAEDASLRRHSGLPYQMWSDFDDNRRQGKLPIFTYSLMGLFLVMLFVSLGLNGWLLESLAVNPMAGPSATTLTMLGAKNSGLIVNDNQAWRLASPMFIQAGFVDCVFNLIALWFVGRAVEKHHGTFASVMIYLVSGFGGIVVSTIFVPELITVGASAGIMGLSGACLADTLRNLKVLYGKSSTDTDHVYRHGWVFLWLIIELATLTFLGIAPFVDNFTQWSAVLYGFLCSFATVPGISTTILNVKQSRTTKRLAILVRFLGLLLPFLAVLGSSVLLFGSFRVSSPCPACRHLSCVPFPPWAEMHSRWWYCDDCGGISADARFDKNAGVFDLLTLQCPNGDSVNVDISRFATSDQEFLSNQLPNICRADCASPYN